MRILLLLLLILPAIVSAQTGSVVINEIAWMGTEVEGIASGQHWRYEFLELYNPTDSATQLSGWELELYRGQELFFAVPLEGSIMGNGYVLVGASSAIPGVDINYSNLGGKFVNDGMRVVVKNAAGVVVDEVNALDGWPAGDNESKRTMERIENGWQTSLAVGGTPRAQNSSGLEEALAAVNEKDPEGSFTQLFSGVSTLPVLPALFLALGSALALVRLRQELFPQS